MRNIENIFHNKKLVATVIRKNFKPKGNIHFFTSSNDPLQIGLHYYQKLRETKLHSNSITKPLRLNARYKYIYIITGSAHTLLIDVFGNILNKINLKAGDSIIIRDVLHKLVFNPGSRAIEIKQGPYEEKK